MLTVFPLHDVSKKQRHPQGVSLKGGVFVCTKICTLAAYERARRVLRGVCDPSLATRAVFVTDRLCQKNRDTHKEWGRGMLLGRYMC